MWVDQTAGLSQRRLKYRITGELASRRLRPLLMQLEGVEWQDVEQVTTGLDFVWETHVPRDWKHAHSEATVLNRLSNSVILEDKAQYALLQARMNVPTLETCILRGAEVTRWAEDRWGLTSGGREGPGKGQDQDWWMVKATGANGGMDVFVFHRGVARDVLQRLHPPELYVLQRYIRNPILFHGRKFHFRCYALLRGDLQPFIYRRAYILAASKPYSMSDSDDLTHLTNLSVNKHVDGYPGELPCCLPEEYPEAFERIKEVWADTISAAAPFMAVQVSKDHFEFFGLDFIVDTDGRAWLLEANRLPGITSSKQNKEEEDRFFDAVIRDLLTLCVLPPVTGRRPHLGDWEAVTAPEGVDLETCKAGEAWKNVLRFGMYSRKVLRRLGLQKDTVGQVVWGPRRAGQDFVPEAQQPRI